MIKKPSVGRASGLVYDFDNATDVGSMNKQVYVQHRNNKSAAVGLAAMMAEPSMKNEARDSGDGDEEEEAPPLPATDPSVDDGGTGDETMKNSLGSSTGSKDDGEDELEDLPETTTTSQSSDTESADNTRANSSPHGFPPEAAS